MIRKDVYIVFGAEGSGKSTHARLLADYLQIPFVSSGSLIREEILKQSDLGKQFVSRRGAYIEDELIIPFILSTLEDKEYQDGFIIEGFPRDLKQLRSLEDFLVQRGLALKKAIYVTLPEQEALKRLLRRGRQDDTEELIKARLEAYKSHKREMIEELTKSNLLVEIDNSLPKEKVFDNLKKKI